MKTDVVIKELNAFLKGQYMGIHAYENYIDKVNDPHIKEELQKIQQDHKNHAIKVSERIQNLGGKPVDDVGFMGSIQEVMSKMKGFPDTTEGILKGAIKGEGYYGIQMSEEIVKGDLDPESHIIIKEILNIDRNHVQHMESLLANN